MDAMDVDYSLNLVDFSMKYGQDHPKATVKEASTAYKKYKDFYLKYHQDHPRATMDCYKEYLEALGK